VVRASEIEPIGFPVCGLVCGQWSLNPSFCVLPEPIVDEIMVLDNNLRLIK
jgi:hypothetical protein